MLREIVTVPDEILKKISDPIEKVGKDLRSKMKFLNSEKLVDKEKN